MRKTREQFWELEEISSDLMGLRALILGLPSVAEVDGMGSACLLIGNELRKKAETIEVVFNAYLEEANKERQEKGERQ
jgi:hypothetical protein